MSILVGSMSMMRNFKNNLWIPVLLIVLCGCIYIFSKGKCESVFSDTEKKSKEEAFINKWKKEKNLTSKNYNILR